MIQMKNNYSIKMSLCPHFYEVFGKTQQSNFLSELIFICKLFNYFYDYIVKSPLCPRLLKSGQWCRVFEKSFKG